MSDPTVEYLTVSEVAEILRMPERSVLRLLKSGSLPGAYGGTRAGWRVRRADVETWTTNRPNVLYSGRPTEQDLQDLHALQEAKQAKKPKTEPAQPTKRPAKKPTPPQEPAE